MRSLRLPSLTLIACFSLACDRKPADGGATAEQTSPAEPTPSKDAAPVEKPEVPEQPGSKSPPKEAPKPKADEATKLRKQLLALLNEGRAATKKGDHQAGMAKYREALAIDASDVAVLGELGWAAFQAGDLELAHRTTTQALKFVRDENRRGMLLYNLGRIAEERDELPAAIENYEASLVARPGNQTVQKHLEAVKAKQEAMAIAGSAGGELEGPDRVAGLDVLAHDLGDLAAACKIIEEQRCEDFTMDESDPCTCDPEIQATPGVDDSWGLVQLGGDESMQAAWFPVVKTDKGWTVFEEVLYTYNPGAFGIFEEAEIGASTVEPLLAKGTQLVMRVTKSRFDRDMGLNEIESEGYEAMIICARHETGAYCARPLITEYSLSREVEFPGEDEEIVGEAIEHEGLPFAVGFEASVEFVEGKLVVKWTTVTGDFEVEGDGNMWSAIGRVLPAGDHALAPLLGLPE
jgi:tetratricopeptide (TPR) repeat protein